MSCFYCVIASGILYTWGGGSDGQNGLGGEDAESPQRLYISGKVVTVACGYYHMAVATGNYQILIDTDRV